MMGTAEADALQTRIYDFLYRLGLNANLFGFQYLSGAIFLSIRNPERFGTFTEELYPELSRLYRVDLDDVRRGIRRVLFLIWKNNPALDGETRLKPLSPGQFLAYARQCLTPQAPENHGAETPEANGETVSGAALEANVKNISGETPEANVKAASGVTLEANEEAASGVTLEK